MNRPEQCICELLYKQTREDNKLDYSTELGGFVAWLTTFEPDRDQEMIDKILSVLCNPEVKNWCLMDIEDIICPETYKNPE